MDTIQNRTFDEIQVGDSACVVRVLTQKDIDLFAAMSGDVNPAHVDEEFAKNDIFHKVVAHGMWGGTLISTVLGTELPGPGTIYVGQTLRFLAPISLGDTVTVTVTATEKNVAKHRIIFDCRVTNQKHEGVITGSAEVIAPTEKVSRPRVQLPDVFIHDKGKRYHQLIALTKGLSPIRVAVVHPVDAISLAGAIEAANAGLIEPILVGPEAKIRQVAEEAAINLSKYRIEATEHSHAAAAKAVAMVQAGDVDALMKGALHTEELMHAVVNKENGLRTERRMSHVFVIDVPRYCRPLFITDAAINVTPTLEQKRDIVQNAIDLAHALKIKLPRVAILSAVETIYPAIPSTIDAGALCKMADRGQITGALVDGPLAFDNAISEAAAKIKGIVSQVAGKADILVVPDLTSGNLLAKQLEYLADAQVAGIVLGARVPIILTSRADGTLSRLASCALAMLLAHHQRSILTGVNNRDE